MTAGSVVQLIDAWLDQRVDPGAKEWLSTRCAEARAHGLSAKVTMAFSAAPRRVGRADLDLSDDDRAAALRARKGWQPGLWSVDQLARTRLVLALPESSEDAYVAGLNRLFEDGDLGELVSLYQALPLLPHQSAHADRAAEGIRTNMKAVFEAVSLRNPYPAERLSDGAWNQLVLKSLFIESPLHEVDGLDERVNAELARMLCDYAHERWAAGRVVSPELWRCVGPVAEGAQLNDLDKVLSGEDELERLAAAISCARNPNADELRARHAEVFASAEAKQPSWASLASRKI